jgi:hypothetical protein
MRLLQCAGLLVSFGLLCPGVAVAAPPPNDQIADATPVTSIPYYRVVHNDEATSQPQDLSCNPPDGHSIWFTVKPTAGTYLARAPSPDAPVNSDVIITSGSADNLQLVSCGLYSAEWLADGTTTYHIEIAKASGSPGGEVDFAIDPVPMRIDVSVNRHGHVLRNGSAIITGHLGCTFPLLSFPDNAIVVIVLHQRHRVFFGQIQLSACIGTTSTSWRMRVSNSKPLRIHPGRARIEVSGDVVDYAQAAAFDVFRRVTLRR